MPFLPATRGGKVSLELQVTRQLEISLTASSTVTTLGWCDGFRRQSHFTSVGFGASNACSLKYNCGMLGREHFVDLFRRRFHHFTFIVWHF
jgi:hypothetical protein